MPRLVSQLTEEQWRTEGPQTPIQKFFFEYATTIDNKVYADGIGGKFYARDVVFHNTNNAKYRGPDEMWQWIQQIFGQFEKLRHDILSLTEIAHDDGRSELLIQMVRNIWLPGNKSDKPEVSAPTFWRCFIGPGDDEAAFGGLQYKEVWLYWDTHLLAPFMKKDAVALQNKNVVIEK